MTSGNVPNLASQPVRLATIGVICPCVQSRSLNEPIHDAGISVEWSQSLLKNRYGGGSSDTFAAESFCNFHMPERSRLLDRSFHRVPATSFSEHFDHHGTVGRINQTDPSGSASLHGLSRCEHSLNVFKNRSD